jgi:type II secretory pathway predicted ATPase ExeA
MTAYLKRFGLTAPPLPKNAQGKTFFANTPGFQKLRRGFVRLCDEPGLGLATAESGVGKTTAIRQLCSELPRPDYHISYLSDTDCSPLALYHGMADALGAQPSHRRDRLWVSLKKTLLHMVDEQGIKPIIVVDEGQLLSDRFLGNLSAFLNYHFDSRDVFTLWLVGMPALARCLSRQLHSALAMRVAASVHLEPISQRDLFAEFVEHGLTSVGATQKLFSDSALELLFRASRGIPRMASKILRTALQLAHERDQNFIDDPVMEAAIDEMTFGALAA